jgi:hypothetical protein
MYVWNIKITDELESMGGEVEMPYFEVFWRSLPGKRRISHEILPLFWKQFEHEVGTFPTGRQWQVITQ